MEMRATGPGELMESGRLLLEDVCSDLVRFLHSGGDPARFQAVRIDREYSLGLPGAFADLRVEPEGEPPYFLEMKYGYDTQTLLAHVRRKYATLTPAAAGATKVVLVVQTDAHRDWPTVAAALRDTLSPELSLEVWNEAELQARIAECFDQTIPSFAEPELLSIRERIDEGKERLAFGATAAAGHAETVLRHNLLWHFGTWRLRELRHARGTTDPAALVPPGVYEHVVALHVDLSGFTRYVHDTHDDAIVRQSLTSFYAKSRYQVINAGGMLVQFVGDAVIALFGIPDRRAGYVEAAIRTATRLLDIGASVSHDWQRKIDHVQPVSGVHIGMAMGRAQLVPMRSLDHSRLAVVADCLNIAARLQPEAAPHEIVVSNVLRHALQASPHEFIEREPFEAHNIGTIRPWRLIPSPAAATAEAAGRMRP